MIIKKLSMFFFIIGTLLAIFSGILEIQDGLENLKVLSLIIFGVFIGLFNVSHKQEQKFLLSSVVFVIFSLTLLNLLSKHVILDNIVNIIINLIYLFGSAALVVSLKSIIEFASEYEIIEEEEFYKKLHHERKQSEIRRIWDIIVFVAVCLLFIIIILRLFFDVWKFESILTFIDYLIYFIFVIDVIILFLHRKDLKEFFKRNWLDIIAVIPLGAFVQLAKLGRLTKLVTLFSKAEKVTKITTKGTQLSTKVITKSSKAIGTGSKIAHSHKVTKFFSNESGFNNYIAKKKPQPKTKKKTKS